MQRVHAWVRLCGSVSCPPLEHGGGSRTLRKIPRIRTGVHPAWVNSVDRMVTGGNRGPSPGSVHRPLTVQISPRAPRPAQPLLRPLFGDLHSFEAIFSVSVCARSRFVAPFWTRNVCGETVQGGFVTWNSNRCNCAGTEGVRTESSFRAWGGAGTGYRRGGWSRGSQG